MARTMLAAAILALAAVPAAGAAQRSDEDVVPTRCATLAECLAEVRETPTDLYWGADRDMDKRIVTFGTPAIDALVAMLADRDPEMRERAGDLLFRFHTIDPKHLPAMVAAWRAGGSTWLPRSVAATGTDEAVRLLWQDFLRGKDRGLQVDYALADLGGERIRPLVLERFAQCRASASGEECNDLYELLRSLRPPFPPWSQDAMVEVAHSAQSREARYEAESMLIDLRHAEAREAARRKLAEYPAEAALQNYWDAQRLINGVADYGPANHASGSVIAGYLDKRYDEDLRANAALALGRIEDRSSIPALLALAPELGDDWLLAYNVAESLGLLHAAEARPLLEHLARDHWHRGVRHNAERALAMIAGGAFARPGVPGDTAPTANQALFAAFASVRHAGDEAPQSCAVPDRKRSTDYDRPLRWSGPAAAALVDTSGSAQIDGTFAASVYRRIPEEIGQGRVVAAERDARGQLVALNGGEFGGGLAYLPRSGLAFTLVREPVAAMWRMGGRIYVAAGLSHLMLDYGHLYVIDPAGPRVERVIRLPASPIRLTAVSERLVVVATEAGDLAVRDDGTPADALLAADCPE